MSALDDPAIYRRVDRSNLRDKIERAHEQARDGWDSGVAWDLAGLERPARVVVVGMGGSAIGADMVATVASHSSTVPVHVIRGYELPKTDDATLVVACSFSGNTSETLSAFRKASKQGRPCIAITGGGALSKFAESAGHPQFKYDWDGPPRTAFGYGLFPLLAILKRLGVIDIADAEVERAIVAIETGRVAWGSEVPTASNPAKQLATEIAGRSVVVIGADFLDAAARRWAGQLNENAKQWAFHGSLPEASHNLVESITSSPSGVESPYALLLDSPLAHPRTRLQLRGTGELLEGAEVPHKQVVAEGESVLETLVWASYLADWVSYYVAILRDVDPMTTHNIGTLRDIPVE